jgi:hypothetical protein
MNPNLLDGNPLANGNVSSSAFSPSQHYQVQTTYPTENVSIQIHSVKHFISFLKMQLMELELKEKDIIAKKKDILNQLSYGMSMLKSLNNKMNQNALFNLLQAIVSKWWIQLLLTHNSTYDPTIANIAPHIGPDIDDDKIVKTMNSHTADLWRHYKNNNQFLQLLTNSYHSFRLCSTKTEKDNILINFYTYNRNYMLREDQSLVVNNNKLAIKCTAGRPYTPLELNNIFTPPLQHQPADTQPDFDYLDLLLGPDDRRPYTSPEFTSNNNFTHPLQHQPSVTQHEFDNLDLLLEPDDIFFDQHRHFQHEPSNTSNKRQRPASTTTDTDTDSRHPNTTIFNCYPHSNVKQVTGNHNYCVNNH